MSPAEIVDLVDFRYLTDALTPDEALELLERPVAGRREREAELLRDGYPAYTTSVGWLGYDDDKIRRLCREALADGWTRFKMKVGADIDDDVRRIRIIRDEIGPDADAGGRRQPALGRRRRRSTGWRGSARSTRTGSRSRPAPTTSSATRRSPGPWRPIRVATGEHVHNRVMFKQFLAAGAMSVCQIDACRLGGVNEVVAVLLLAAKFGVPVCPHAGGVGLCELVQHLVDLRLHRASAGALDGRMIEYVDHLHEHFVDPVVIRDGRYRLPTRPGYSAEMQPESLATLPLPGRRRVAVRRFGQVIRVRPDAIEEYERLHAEPWPGVLAAIDAANIRNYSIYRHGELLFAYLRVRRRRPRGGPGAIAADPIIQQWWTLTDAMQDPYPEREPGSWWLTLPEIFHTGGPSAAGHRRQEHQRVALAHGCVERLEVADVGVVEERVDEPVQVAVRRRGAATRDPGGARPTR